MSHATLPEILREKARGCELNAVAKADAGNETAGNGFLVAAIVLHEVADAVEQAETDVGERAA